MEASHSRSGKASLLHLCDQPIVTFGTVPTTFKFPGEKAGQTLRDFHASSPAMLYRLLNAIRVGYIEIQFFPSPVPFIPMLKGWDSRSSPLAHFDLNGVLQCTLLSRCVSFVDIMYNLWLHQPHANYETRQLSSSHQLQRYAQIIVSTQGCTLVTCGFLLALFALTCVAV